ncbi:hypothetical protein A2415_00020 [candidate division WWE3 bacterium RIFOXYC1_FULL_39_7]|uniref:Uncharacterized protein n=1 Tax=candidate division WWE3 bacterium RIFOXYC1_FULL_39_7 TaxID=1802643 RepID=A0A1F4WGA4_UNCKA|nr:MAG: hypothetical protein A2415_00020 [candidate division WWE3 bacterium RIFOXYC1_FULL_39_7]
MKPLLITIVITIIGLLLVGGLFYWFQFRPTKIKHGCSWVKMHSDAIPARDGMTEGELKEKGLLKTCPSPPPSLLDQYISNKCEVQNQDIIDANKHQEYVPAKDWYREATPQEYSFCLHDRGM